MSAEKKTIHVVLADAPTDVLLYLVASPADTYWTWHGIRDEVAPPDAVGADKTVMVALRLLKDGGYVEVRSIDGIVGWRATARGRAAVAHATPGDPS